MSVITWTEFLCGPVEATGTDLAARMIEEPEPLVAGDALVAARLFNLGGRRRGSLMDCMIAAVAIRIGAELATTNAADFRRFESAGLALVSADDLEKPSSDRTRTSSTSARSARRAAA